MPVGDVLVGDTGGNIEHDDTALAVDVVAIAQTTELLLTSGVPDVELDGAQVLSNGKYSLEPNRYRALGGAYGSEAKRVDLDTEGGNVLLLEFTGQVTLDEGGL